MGIVHSDLNMVAIRMYSHSASHVRSYDSRPADGRTLKAVRESDTAQT
jgi:hypothetical protein